MKIVYTRYSNLQPTPYLFVYIPYLGDCIYFCNHSKQGDTMTEYTKLTAEIQDEISTIDIFGDTATDRQRLERIEIQKRQKATKGGIAQTGDLPIFSNQIDLFDPN